VIGFDIEQRLPYEGTVTQRCGHSEFPQAPFHDVHDIAAVGEGNGKEFAAKSGSAGLSETGGVPAAVFPGWTSVVGRLGSCGDSMSGFVTVFFRGGKGSSC
jgi:hypothetical protein